MSKAAGKRRNDVLKIIVNEYIATAMPVASEWILRHHSLGVSSATIRNDMASLEEEGFITRPYTSSGGVPLDKGYRFYVETTSGVDLPQSERQRVRHLLDSAFDEYDKLLRTAAAAVSQLVGNAAIVTFPRSAQSKFKHIELLALQEYVAMLILIMSNATLRKQTLTFDEPVTQAQLDELASRLNSEHTGQTQRQIAGGPSTNSSHVDRKVLEAVRDIMSSEDRTESDNSYTEGLRLMLGQPEFTQRERMLDALELMETRGWLRHVVDWQVTDEAVKVVIGEENPEAALRELSLVVGNYGVPDQARGAIGVIGPKRMDYRRTISAVNYISGLLSELVARVCGDN